MSRLTRITKKLGKERVVLLRGERENQNTTKIFRPPFGDRACIAAARPRKTFFSQFLFFLEIFSDFLKDNFLTGYCFSQDIVFTERFFSQDIVFTQRFFSQDNFLTGCCFFKRNSQIFLEPALFSGGYFSEFSLNVFKSFSKQRFGKRRTGNRCGVFFYWASSGLICVSDFFLKIFRYSGPSFENKSRCGQRGVLK